MAIKYTETETGMPRIAVGDHDGWVARVTVKGSVRIGQYVADVSIGQRGEFGQGPASYRTVHTLEAPSVDQAYVNGFAVAEVKIGEQPRR